MANGLSAKQSKFVAAYIGEANGNATEAARLAGYGGNDVTLRAVGHENLTKPHIIAVVDAWRAEIKAQGIATKQNRLAAYNERWERLQRIIEARAADPRLANVPGGDTGLIWDASVDTALLKELREHEKQAAQEMGQWAERQEHGGPDGGPIWVEVGGARDELLQRLERIATHRKAGDGGV